MFLFLKIFKTKFLKFLFGSCFFPQDTLYLLEKRYIKKQEGINMFILLAGGLLIIIVAVIVAVVSSVASAVAAESDTTE